MMTMLFSSTTENCKATMFQVKSLRWPRFRISMHFQIDAASALRLERSEALFRDGVCWWVTYNMLSVKTALRAALVFGGAVSCHTIIAGMMNRIKSQRLFRAATMISLESTRTRIACKTHRSAHKQGPAAPPDSGNVLSRGPPGSTERSGACHIVRISGSK